MIRVDEVRARIEALVPELSGRFENAGAFARLIESNQVPQMTPAGFVLPGPIAGGAADLAAGLFRQSIDETVFVVIAVRSAADATGSAALDEATPLVRAVAEAVMGWGPDDAPGVFVLGRIEMVGSMRGVMIFQIDFSLQDQVRLAR